MITAALQGGLGNQMFQYAMGYAQAKRLNTELVLSKGRLAIDANRQYTLGLFNVTERVIDEVRKPVVKEDGLPYNSELAASIKDGDTLIGYWQSEKYFAQHKAVLDKIFTSWKMWDTASEYDLTVIEDAGPRSTFLGVRRGDYVQKQDYHGLMPMEYYQEGLKIIAKKIGLTPVVYVFSDEPEWCADNLRIDYPFVVLPCRMTTKKVLGREDIDMGLMSACHNAVIPNSTFSWWGAWLGQEKNVVAPKKWFTTPDLDWKDIVPERWTQI